MEIPVTIFDTLKISMIFYSIIVIVAVIIIGAFGLYIVYDYYKGTALKQLFWGRLKRWMPNGKKIAVFEIFDSTNKARLEYAHSEIGGIYKFGENSKEYIKSQKAKKPSKFTTIISILSFKKKSELKPIINDITNDIITPKSVYNINSIPVIPLFEPYPKLNIDIEKGLNALIAKNIKTLEEFVNIVSDNEKKNEILFDNYTYERFYELFMDSKNKYELNITIKDVVGFMSKENDDNFRFSIESKEFNVKTANKSDKSMLKYSYYICGICALIAVGLFVYKRIYG